MRASNSPIGRLTRRGKAVTGPCWWKSLIETSWEAPATGDGMARRPGDRVRATLDEGFLLVLPAFSFGKARSSRRATSRVTLRTAHRLRTAPTQRPQPGPGPASWDWLSSGRSGPTATAPRPDASSTTGPGPAAAGLTTTPHPRDPVCPVLRGPQRRLRTRPDSPAVEASAHPLRRVLGRQLSPDALPPACRLVWRSRVGSTSRRTRCLAGAIGPRRRRCTKWCATTSRRCTGRAAMVRSRCASPSTPRKELLAYRRACLRGHWCGRNGPSTGSTATSATSWEGSQRTYGPAGSRRSERTQSARTSQSRHISWAAT